MKLSIVNIEILHLECVLLYILRDKSLFIPRVGAEEKMVGKLKKSFRPKGLGNEKIRHSKGWVKEIYKTPQKLNFQIGTKWV